jgi:pimeloyl-ACP methyl ester carboxylesterase
MRRLALMLVVLIALVALAAVANALLTTSETKPAEADIGRILSLPEGDVQVRQRGPVDAPAIVLVHCYTCSMHWWQQIEPLLARENRVISVDLLGHGGSEKPEDGYAIEDQADMVAAVLRKLDERKALAVGQSLGGPIVTALAERHRPLVRGLVVMDSAPANDFANLPTTAKIARAPVIGPALRTIAPDSVVRDELSKAFAEGFEVPDQFIEDVRRMTFLSFRESAELSRDYSDERSLDDRLTEVGLPLLVIFGAEDRIVEPEAADEYRDVPNGRVVVLPGVGHTPQMEQPRRAAALITGFDRTIPASRP